MACNNLSLSALIGVLVAQSSIGLLHGDCKIHSELSTTSVCRVWEVRAGIQIFKTELHTHICLNYIKIEFLSYKKKILQSIFFHSIIKKIKQEVISVLTWLDTYYIVEYVFSHRVELTTTALTKLSK